MGGVQGNGQFKSIRGELYKYGNSIYGSSTILPGAYNSHHEYYLFVLQD